MTCSDTEFQFYAGSTHKFTWVVVTSIFEDDGSDTPLDLTGAAVNLKIDGIVDRLTTIDPDQVTNPGKLSFQFAAGETDSLTETTYAESIFKYTKGAFVAYAAGPKFKILERL